MYKLRLLDFIGEHTVRSLPVVLEGSLETCRWYAADKGYVWKPVPLSIAGGYFAHPDTGNVLYLDR